MSPSDQADCDCIGCRHNRAIAQKFDIPWPAPGDTASPKYVTVSRWKPQLMTMQLLEDGSVALWNEDGSLHSIKTSVEIFKGMVGSDDGSGRWFVRPAN